jgi:hypothetical protein
MSFALYRSRSLNEIAERRHACSLGTAAARTTYCVFGSSYLNTVSSCANESRESLCRLPAHSRGDQRRVQGIRT